MNSQNEQPWRKSQDLVMGIFVLWVLIEKSTLIIVNRKGEIGHGAHEPIPLLPSYSFSLQDSSHTHFSR